MEDNVEALHYQYHQKAKGQELKIKNPNFSHQPQLSNLCEIVVEPDSLKEDEAEQSDVEGFLSDKDDDDVKVFPRAPPVVKRKKTTVKTVGMLKHFKNAEDTGTLLTNPDNLWCWWCCHPFKGKCFVMPTQYDQLRQRFRVKGNFCSWSCVKSYIHDSKAAHSHHYGILLTLLVKKKWRAVLRPFFLLPPREVLKVFGGILTIKEFRSVSNVKYYTLHNQQLIYEK